MRAWLKFALAGIIALLLTLLVGFVWGRSGKSDLQRALTNAELRLATSQARGHVLAARVSLYKVNFGDASSQLEDAKPALRRAIEQFQQQGQEDLARRVAAAVDHVAEAQRLAGRLDQSANSRAAEAEKELDAVIAALPPATVPPQ